MNFGLDPEMIRFGAPGFLWFLAVPVALLYLWLRQVSARRRDAGAFRTRRLVPVRERFPLFGNLPFSLGLIAASATLFVALARPQAVVSRIRKAGIDLVVLADASASMHVEDVAGNRWRRSMKFLSVLGNSLNWNDDRIAMALFAHIAAPQVRLTKDPNAFFFFLEHLAETPPFRLEANQTWDTNVELGIHWGIRLIAKDQELHGKSQNSPVFLLISDGQVWSGVVEKSLNEARKRGIPVFVLGVGTMFGGLIPEPKLKPKPYFLRGGGQAEDDEPPPPPERSSLNRTSLRTIAAAGEGQYFELDDVTDRQLANQILDLARRHSGSRQFEERTEELYWRFLLIAACFAAAGTLSLRERTELWMQVVCAVATLLSVSTLLR